MASTYETGMQGCRRLRVVGLLLLLGLVVPSAIANPSPIVLRVEDPAGKRQFIVYLDGVRVDVPTLLGGLGRRINSAGKDALVLVLISDRQPLEHVRSIRAMVGKAGPPKARYFQFSPDRRMMGELLFGGVMPFSENPPFVPSSEPFPAEARADEKAGHVQVAGTYSSVEYNDESGDLLGMEIKVVPAGSGFQAVILTCEGSPGPMHIVPLSVTGSEVSFIVREDEDTSWSFRGTVTAASLTGTVTHSLGGSETVTLPRRCGYWDRG